MKFPLSQRIAAAAPYAFAEIDKKVSALRSKGVEVIDFGVGDPSSPTPEFVIKSLNQAAKNHEKSGYPSYIGSDIFRQSCADYMQKTFSVTLDPQTEISSTIGSKEAVFNFPLGFVDPGDIVICPTPGYPPYKVGTRFAGGVPYFVPLLEENDFLIDLDAIPEEICQKAKIIWTNYPNSPTGRYASREFLKKLIAFGKKYNIIIAADEGCYIDIYFEGKPLSILELTKTGVITFYSLSKRNNMTGYRCGFVAGDADIVEAFKKVKTNIDSGTPDFIQNVSALALANDEHIIKMRKEYQEKRDILATVFDECNFPKCPSDGTFYLWQKAPNNSTGENFALELLEVGIVVTPGAYISDETDSGINPGKHFVRFALVAPLENVKEAAKRIREKFLSCS